MVHASDAPQVTDNQAESRLEIKVDGITAEFRRNARRLVFIHTEVPPGLESGGIGGRLATAAIDRAAKDSMTIVPLCPFARGWRSERNGSAEKSPNFREGAAMHQSGSAERSSGPASSGRKRRPVGRRGYRLQLGTVVLTRCCGCSFAAGVIAPT